MTALAKPPSPMTLPALQRYVREIVAARNFTKDRNEIFILLVEEVGELAAEFKNRTFYPERYDLQNLSYELADILLYLIDLANGFDLDLMACWPTHEETNDRRFAERRGGRAPARLQQGITLDELQLHLEAKRKERGFEDSPEILMVLLSEEVGEIATEIRKSWKGRADPQRVAHEIIDTMTYLLRIAGWFGTSMETAVREKEARNAERIWRY